MNRGANNKLVYQEVGLLPLRRYCMAAAATTEAHLIQGNNSVKSVLGVSQASNNTRDRKQVKKKTPMIHRVTTTLDSYTKPIWSAVGRCPTIAEPTVIPIPPWCRLAPSFNINYACDIKKNENPLLLEIIAKEQLEGYGNHLKYYTDGSLKSNKSVGYGFVIPQTKIYECRRLNDGASIFAAELAAIKLACLDILKLPDVPQKVAIISDSKSVLQALNRGGSNNRNSMQLLVLKLCHAIITKGSKLDFLWVPSHTNIRGNEDADKAAKQGTEELNSEDIGLSRSEIKSKVFTVARSRWQQRLQNYCATAGHIFLPSGASETFTLPRKLQKIIRRINLGRHAYLDFPKSCACGVPASLNHVFSGCDRLKMEEVDKLIRSQTFIPEDFLKPHPTLNTELMRIFSESIISSEIVGWF